MSEEIPIHQELYSHGSWTCRLLKMSSFIQEASLLSFDRFRDRQVCPTAIYIHKKLFHQMFNYLLLLTTDNSQNELQSFCLFSVNLNTA